MAFLQVLKIKAFRNLWLSQLFSQVFLNLLFFSLIIRVYEVTRSNAAVSVLVFLQAIPNIFVGALAGVLVDRWGRKQVMFLSHFLRIFFVLGFLFSPETVVWIYVLVLLIGVATQFFFPAEAGAIPQVVQDKKLLLTANSLFSLTFFASVIVGNVLAGPFLLFFGPNLTFIIVAAAFFLASCFTSQLPGNGTIHIQTITMANVFSDFLAGVNHLYRTPKVRLGIFLLGASQITIGILGTIAPGFADLVLKMKVADISLMVMAPAAMGMAIGAIILGQFFRKSKRSLLIKIGFFAAPAVLVIYSLNVSILLSVFIIFFLGIANAFLDIPVNTMIQENTPEEIRSRVYGFVSSIIGVASILPIILSGVLADLIGVKWVMLITGLLLLMLAFLYNRSKYAADS